MTFLRSLMTDLRERQVLPAVLLLVVLAVAIPVGGTILYSKSSAPAPVIVPPVNAAPPKGTPPPAQELLTVQAPPAQKSVTFKGVERDPFASASAASSGGSSNSGSGSSAKSGSSSTPRSTPKTGSTAKAGSNSHTRTGTHTHTGSGSGIVTVPRAPSSGSGSKSGSASTSPKPAPSSLGSDEVYTVNVSASYGDQTAKLDNLERLTPLPPNTAAEVVFLGVMKGGKKAAFLLTGAVAVKRTMTGSVTCKPSASDCEVVELPVGAQLTLTPSPSSSGVSTFTLKLSAIGATKLSSAAAAAQARQSAAAAGEAILGASTSSVLASFVYDAGQGALVYEPQNQVGTSGATGTSGASGSSGSTG